MISIILTPNEPSPHIMAFALKKLNGNFSEQERKVINGKICEIVNDFNLGGFDG